MFRLISVPFFCALAAFALPACTAEIPGDAVAAPIFLNNNAPRVLVFPFTPIGNVGTFDWIGRGVQQSLLADLSSSHAAEVVFPAAQPAQGPVDPVAIASQANASAVIVGSYQINENQVRITAEVFDVPSGRNLGGLKATGPVADLFKLEDSLQDQLQRLVPGMHPSVPTPAANAPQVIRPQTDTPYAQDTSTPVYVQSETPSTTYVYNYPADYSYPYAYSYYPGPAFGFIGVFGGSFHDHGFHHGFEHSHFNHFGGRSFNGGFHAASASNFGRFGSGGGFRGGFVGGSIRGGGGFSGGFGGAMHGGGGFSGRR